MTKNNPLHIVIFDGSFATTAFINRLIKGLAINHEVYVLGFNERLTHKVENIHYVPLGSNQNKIRFGLTTLNYAIKTKSYKCFYSTVEKIIRGERKNLQEQNLRFFLKTINPDIIHVQWPSLLPWLEDILRAGQYKVIISQRGSQSNIVPFSNQDNFEYLQQWYPKISAFHSVSKAISINGDKIWKSGSKLNRVVYTGLALQEFSFSDDYSPSNPLLLLSVGRSHWVKGYHYALQACKQLKEKKIPFHFTIIGGSGDEELQFLIADLELQGCVSLEDRLPQKEVFKRMRAASLLLIPSVEEGVPNVAVEAMALGLPVICTDCGGVSELIEDEVEGWLVPIRDPQPMADKVEAFLKLPLEKIEEVRLAARKKVEEQHSEEMMINGMVDLYREVIAR